MPRRAAALGINYGQVGNNLPSPPQVVQLLSSLRIGKVRIYDVNPQVLSAFAGTGIELIAMTPRSTSVRRSSPGHGRQPVQRRCTSRPSVTGIYRSGEWTTSSPPHATCRRRWRRSRRTHGRVDACVHGQLPRRARHLLHAGGNNDEVDPTAPRSIGHARVACARLDGCPEPRTRAHELFLKRSEAKLDASSIGGSPPVPLDDSAWIR